MTRGLRESWPSHVPITYGAAVMLTCIHAL